MNRHGFARVAVACPALVLADPRVNADASLESVRAADAAGADVAVLPEMGLVGYTAHDLFQQRTLVRAALDALTRVAEGTRGLGVLALVGLPVDIDGQLFNAAAAVQDGRVLGLVPKLYLPTYKEFYDARYFASGFTLRRGEVELPGLGRVPVGADLLFEGGPLTVGVEICEDLWTPVPPSCRQALHGATLLANLSASNETIAKAAYRRTLVSGQSARCLAAYAYAGAGLGESSTDVVFGGHCLVAENGGVVAESERFADGPTLTLADIDVERLRFLRTQTGTFAAGLVGDRGEPFRRVPFVARDTPDAGPLHRRIDAHPFVPADDAERDGRCREIFSIQTCGLARRLAALGERPVAIGVSGGLDSTLALLVACKTLDRLKRPRSLIRGITMPGFGTTSRTLANARTLMRELGITASELDIRPTCLEQMRALGHRPFGLEIGADESADAFTERLRALPPEQRRNDLTFENVQARARTSLLMNTAFVIGTGDLSELALGWCTYNADHMSMYNVNVSVPKTLVKFLVAWAAHTEFGGEVRRTLLDIVDTDISPELLPTGAGGRIEQTTETLVGPYELHDFFLYHLLRFGAPPGKILYLARRAAFSRAYSDGELRRWLGEFVRRFFASQFKRSCLPDGPKVGTVSVSPRGDWRMPSDASAAAFRADLEGEP